jgi:hypothetical protein
MSLVHNTAVTRGYGHEGGLGCATGLLAAADGVEENGGHSVWVYPRCSSPA